MVQVNISRENGIFEENGSAGVLVATRPGAGLLPAGSTALTETVAGSLTLEISAYTMTTHVATTLNGSTNMWTLANGSTRGQIKRVVLDAFDTKAALMTGPSMGSLSDCGGVFFGQKSGEWIGIWDGSGWRTLTVYLAMPSGNSSLALAPALKQLQVRQTDKEGLVVGMGYGGTLLVDGLSGGGRLASDISDGTPDTPITSTTATLSADATATVWSPTASPATATLGAGTAPGQFKRISVTHPSDGGGNCVITLASNTTLNTLTFTQSSGSQWTGIWDGSAWRHLSMDNFAITTV